MSLHTKIPCEIIIFSEYEIIKKSLDYFIKFSDRLEITVVENKSNNTEDLIKPYVLELLQQKKIYQYILFDKNLASNAAVIVHKKKLIPQTTSPYFIMSDGDLICDNDNWLEEEISILEQNKEVFAVATDLIMTNLPKLPNSENWVKKAQEVKNKNYNLGTSGIWFLMYRRKEFEKCLDYLISKAIIPIDSSQHKYCSHINKYWARTKKSKAYHLTWDLYRNENHPYTIYKQSKSFKDHWQHNKYSNYTIYKLCFNGTIKNKRGYYFPLISKLEKAHYKIKRLINFINIIGGT